MLLANQRGSSSRIQEKASFKMRMLGILLGVGATFVAILATFLKTFTIPESTVTLLTIMVALMPILQTVVLSITGRFYAPSRWKSLRICAEKLMRELYLYRTCTGVYATQFKKQHMASELKKITRDVMGTEAAAVAAVDDQDDKGTWLDDPEEARARLGLRSLDNDILGSNEMEVNDYITQRLQVMREFFLLEASEKNNKLPPSDWFAPV